ncbi:tail fiber assembly protein [Pantoea vagans]|uniref:tail fiber assembly protein n=1 Tax=Pantoea vagans TaxID=470934 RepID=UPI0030182D4B
MTNYALIEDGKVINTIVWDGPTASPMDFGKGVTAVEIKDGYAVSTGYTYADGEFAAPPLTEEEISGQEETAVSSNLSYKDQLMSEATQRIAILQDAVDLEMATDDEAKLLPLWKKYRVLLSRVSANTSGEISWPTKPE